MMQFEMRHTFNTHGRDKKIKTFLSEKKRDCLDGVQVDERIVS
jgi:hypothetical protein